MPHGAIGDMEKWDVPVVPISRRINYGVNIDANITESNTAGDGNHALNKFCWRVGRWRLAGFCPFVGANETSQPPAPAPSLEF